MDEVASFMDATAFGREGLAGLAAADHIAPLHAILIWLTTLVSAPTESVLRIPSVIFGAAVVPVFGWLVYDMFRDRRLAAVGTLLMCCSPYAIWYSQEVRMYSLYLFFSVVFVTLSWKVFERRFADLCVWALFVRQIGLEESTLVVGFNPSLGSRSIRVLDISYI
jgi:predicted membrane-bound mannosyltransferase